MSRARARLLVGLAAAASAALVVGVTVLQAEDGGSSEPAATQQPERRPPPLELGLLVRDDPEARALREAEDLLDEGERD